MVTHDPVAAGYTDLAVILVDGHIVDRIDTPSPRTVFERMDMLERRTAP